VTDTFTLGTTRFLIEVKAPDQIDPALGRGPLLTLHKPLLATNPDHEAEVRRMLGSAHVRRARASVVANRETQGGRPERELIAGDMDDVPQESEQSSCTPP